MTYKTPLLSLYIYIYIVAGQIIQKHRRSGPAMMGTYNKNKDDGSGSSSSLLVIIEEVRDLFSRGRSANPPPVGPSQTYAMHHHQASVSGRTRLASMTVIKGMTWCS